MSFREDEEFFDVERPIIEEEDLNEKIKRYFDGRIVRKDLTKKIKEGAMALKILPKAKIIIPSNRVLRLPKISTSLPKIGAQAAVEMAWDKAVQVVLL